MAKKNQTTAYCHCCGEPLTEENCRKVNNSISGYSHLCISCENDFYQRLANAEGDYIALFHACAALDVRMYPLALEGMQDTFNSDGQGWITYINALTELKADTKIGKILGFADGETYLKAIFGRDMTEKDFGKYLENEKKKIAKQIGTEEQRERWGTQPLYKGIAWTKELYDELDRLYEIRANSYKGQTITPQMDDTLIKVAKSNVIYDHLMRNGLVKMALDVQKNIDLLLASEQMRKKDEKPIANFTPDAWVDAFEKAGLMQDGQFLPLSEIEDAMIKIMRGKGYEQTLDAAHQLELNIINNARKNADQQTIFELPEDMRITDELGEFATAESDEEREAKSYAQLTTVRFEKKNG